MAKVIDMMELRKNDKITVDGELMAVVGHSNMGSSDDYRTLVFVKDNKNNKYYGVIPRIRVEVNGGFIQGEVYFDPVLKGETLESLLPYSDWNWSGRDAITLL
jgi:hypothetical protein